MTGTDGSSLRWPRDRVVRVEVGTSESRFDATGCGMMIGGGVGLAGGAALGSRGSSGRTVLALGLGLVGSIVGGTIGYNLVPIHWRELPLAPVVGASGRELGVTLAF